MSRVPLSLFRRLPWWAVLLIAGVLLAGQRYGWFDNAGQLAGNSSPGLYSVSRISDGDTIIVNMNGAKETVRFIGVDTPETRDPRKAVQCYGQIAADFTKNLIGNKPVRLEADPLNTNRDRYNRLLRYIYLPDGTLVNAVLIERGYGFAYTGFPFTKISEFKSYQDQAMAAKAGLWNSCQPTQNENGGYTSNDAT